jgi:Carboxypeptidase regulatory-like domain
MSTRKLMGRTHCTLAFSFLIRIIPAIGQARSRTITGSVEDSSGATVTDANVTVTDTGTNISYSTKTTQSGLYTVPYLAPGTYSVSISQLGFVTYTANLKPPYAAKYFAAYSGGRLKAQKTIRFALGPSIKV